MTREEAWRRTKGYLYDVLSGEEADEIIKALEQTRWIPVSERLPKELEPVNITWVNHNPESYYADIKDKPFTATGVYFNGQWYWWSTLCTDILAEYSHNYDDIIDDDIEITAWMPLPEPYKAESEETTNLCNQCANERCVMQSGICRNNCEFFIAKESEDKE